MPKGEPLRGEIYEADLSPTEGREQAGRRPLLVLSIDPMNRSAADLVVGVPMTTTNWDNAMHVRIDPRDGLEKISFAMPEMVRSVSRGRLLRQLGTAPVGAVDSVAKRVGLLIGLGRTK